VQPFAADGSFMFAMTVNLPLNPGRYEVGVQAPGYAPSSRPVEIAGHHDVVASRAHQPRS
jgi:hypothetical protein